MFEARRFVELRKKPFWDQFMSAESFGMGVFYTANVRERCFAACWLRICLSWTCPNLLPPAQQPDSRELLCVVNNRRVSHCLGECCVSGQALKYKIDKFRVWGVPWPFISSQV